MMIPFPYMGAVPALSCRLFCLDSFGASTSAALSRASLCPEVARSGPMQREGGRG